MMSDLLVVEDQLTRWALATVQTEQTLHRVTGVVAAFGHRTVHNIGRRSFMLLALWKTSFVSRERLR